MKRKANRTIQAKRVAVVVALVLVSASCGVIGKKDAKASPATGKAATGSAAAEAEKAAAELVFAVNTTTAVQGQIKDYIALSGDLVSGTTVDAYSDVAGKVTKLFVSVGTRVARGDPLAEVDPSKPGMNYIPGIAKAPISGTVVALPAELGMTITQAVPVARLSRTDALELRTYVAERFVSKLKVGLNADVTLDAVPGGAYRAVVRELSPVIDPSSRTMEVRLRLVSPDSKLKSGMFAKVKILTEEKDGIVKIPANAVVKRFGENYVFTVQSDPADVAFLIARKKKITQGILIDDKLEVRSGLEPNEEIVVRGQTLLEDGSRVNVVDRLAPLAAAE